MAIARIAFYKGRARLFNRLVSWWTKGKFSHCELIEFINEDGSAASWSSSFSDGGVRRKNIDMTEDKWEVVEVEVSDAVLEYAFDWFRERCGKPYDVIGLFGFIWGASKDSPNSWFCSEAVASALQIDESWRFSPNDLYVIVKSMKV